MLPPSWPHRMPWGLLAAAAGLLALGWCGIARSEELGDGTGRYLWQQVVWSLVAVAAGWLMLLPSYRVISRYTYAVFAVAIALLVAVYFFPTVHGTHRWLRVGRVGLQPSEFAKVAFVLALARYLMYRDNYRRLRGLLVPLALALVPLVLILREPDLGTSLVFLPVLFAMLYAAGARQRDLVALALCGVAALPVLWTQMSGEQRSRVTALFEQTGPGEKPTDDGYHLFQAKQMLALGGKWGSLLAGEPVDDRAVYHLPEDHTDFVFVVIIERLGWLGALAVLSLEGIVVIRSLMIAEVTREPFGRLAALGLATLVGVQTIINTAMTVGLLPITGLSLPLVSYGGSGLLAHGILLGLLVNIALRPGFEVATAPFRFVERPAAA
ncbi:MAG TPA: FtsW/RodA/SpoVE family cell cycle protein [Pirellulales bacterium]